MTKSNAKKCPWCGNDPLYVAYHDLTWGRPVQKPRELFAKLCLDGQQAGLSWITILRKEAAYHEVFYNFDPLQIVSKIPKIQHVLLNNPNIIRSELKIKSIVNNSRVYLDLTSRGENFGEFLWSFVDGRPINHKFRELQQIPKDSDQSRSMSKALKKMGFSFVGPTICYAFMQAVGMVNDHLLDCPSYEQCAAKVDKFVFLRQPDAPVGLGAHHR